jgi:hypothetical protein
VEVAVVVDVVLVLDVEDAVLTLVPARARAVLLFAEEEINGVAKKNLKIICYYLAIGAV